MICPKCDADIGDSYEPADRSVGIRGGWYCDACAFAVVEHDIPREPMVADVERMSTRELRGDEPLGILTSSDFLDDAEPSVVARPTAMRSKRSGVGFTWNMGMNEADFFTVEPSRHITSFLLTTAAMALSGVGIAINGSFARSLGASDLAGWLFLAIGVATDLVALVLPSTAAGLWRTGHQSTAVTGWIIWFVTFTFAVTAAIGFASTNISDVTLVRASRRTPAITSAEATLTDAMAARDRECKGGVGKFCREREAAVVEQRRILDAAMTKAGQSADPQAEAAIRLVAWASGGTLRPEAGDFAMLRLLSLALLPQIGGMLLMIGRRPQTVGGRQT